MRSAGCVPSLQEELCDTQEREEADTIMDMGREVHWASSVRCILQAELKFECELCKSGVAGLGSSPKFSPTTLEGCLSMTLNTHSPDLDAAKTDIGMEKASEERRPQMGEEDMDQDVRQIHLGQGWQHDCQSLGFMSSHAV